MPPKRAAETEHQGAMQTDSNKQLINHTKPNVVIPFMDSDYQMINSNQFINDGSNIKTSINHHQQAYKQTNFD